MPSFLTNCWTLYYYCYYTIHFALFNTEQDALSFYSYINIQHPNITFTIEREENQKFPFLDIPLDNNTNQGIITSVFHKKTYTGLSLETTIISKEHQIYAILIKVNLLHSLWYFHCALPP